MTAQPIELPHPAALISTATAIDRTALEPPNLPNLPDGRPGWIEGVQGTSRGCQPWQIIPDCFVPDDSTDILSANDFVTLDNQVIEPFTVSAVDGCKASALNPRMQDVVEDRVRAAVVSKLPAALAQQIEVALTANRTGGLGTEVMPSTAFARLLDRNTPEEIRIWAASVTAVPILQRYGLIRPTSAGRGYVGPLGMPFLPLTSTLLDDVANSNVTLWSAPGIWGNWRGTLDAPTVEFYTEGSHVDAPFDDSVGGAHVSGGNVLGNQYVVSGRLRAIVVVPDCNVVGQTMCIAENLECS